MQQTEHLKLNLIEGTDPVDRAVLNENFETLEQEMADIREDLLSVTAGLGTAGKNARIAWGTYTGTGTYGASSPTSVSPGFYPVAVMVGAADATGNYGWPTTFLRGCPRANGVGIHSYMLENVSWSDSGVSWYDTQYADYQMNTSGTVYYYVAIGYDKMAE